MTRARLAALAERTDEVFYFTDAANSASIALHQRLGFAERCGDFTFPGVDFTSGRGRLFVLRLGDPLTSGAVAGDRAG